MAETTAPSLVARAAAAPPRSIQRKLLVAAAFCELALDDGVLVGGAAADLHTGMYHPTDVDLVGVRRRGHPARLTRLGFVKDGRHWVIEFDDGEAVAVEVPGDRLFDFATEQPMIVDLEPGRLSVISLNDLMMDRLLAATGGESVTYDEALRLAIAAYPSIDWSSLEERSVGAALRRTSAGKVLPGILKRIRQAARRALRG